MKPHLTCVSRKSPRNDASEAFPFSVRAIRSLERLELNAAVTFFVGANGSGKSTLLEGVAAAAALPAVGAMEVTTDATLAAQRRLGEALRLTWSRRVARGFFLRAEDFFGFAKRLAQERAEMQARVRELAEEDRAQDRSATALRLRQGPARASLTDMERRYGTDFDANSHGESFLK